MSETQCRDEEKGHAVEQGPNRSVTRQGFCIDLGDRACKCPAFSSSEASVKWYGEGNAPRDANNVCTELWECDGFDRHGCNENGERRNMEGNRVKTSITDHTCTTVKDNQCKDEGMGLARDLKTNEGKDRFTYR